MITCDEFFAEFGDYLERTGFRPKFARNLNFICPNAAPVTSFTTPRART